MRTVLIVLFFSVLLNAAYPHSRSLDGTWRYHVQHHPESLTYRYRFGGNEATMALPANWYKAGINHAGVVWFERTFDLSAINTDHHYFLEFYGVDYLCDVWVNDKHVGKHTGYFQRFDFDVTHHVKQGNNRITIRVNSPLENYPEHYSLHKTLLRGIFSHHDTRPGGAWSPKGQDRNSGGIWDSIYLKTYRDHKIDRLKITPRPDAQGAQIAIEFALTRFNGSGVDQAFSIFGLHPATSDSQSVTVTLTPANFDGDSVMQTFETTDGTDQHFLMNVNDVRLWHTHDRGFAHLYDLTVTIGKTSRTQRIGIREIVKTRDDVIKLNGTPLFLKGTNYISSQYMSEMDEEALRHDLELMKAAHINTIRVHAHVEPKRFYDLADEMGFLVWQDYNLQWGYIESPAFNREALKQAIEMVDQLYSHPSVFLWCMHNEPPWDSSWMKWKYKDYNPNQNRALDDQLYEAVRRHDDFHLIKKVSTNLEHPWFGWYSGSYYDFIKPSKAPIITEFGAQALPDYATLVSIVSNDYLVPKKDKAKKKWEYHNFQFDWNAKNGIKFKGSVQKLINDSQTYQHDLIKYAAEMLRLQKYNGTTAIYQFMFNEGWPSMNWGIVDYRRHPKPGYEALKLAFSPVLPIIKKTGNTLTLYVVNDTLKTFERTTLTYRVGSQSKTFYPNVRADSVTEVKTLPLTHDASITLHLEFDGEQITNSYRFRAKKKDKK